MRKITVKTHPKGAQAMKSYVFPVVLEKDGNAWRALVPHFEDRGLATWGKTRSEALKNIQEVVQLFVEELVDESQPVPSDIKVFNRPVVAVSV